MIPATRHTRYASGSILVTLPTLHFQEAKQLKCVPFPHCEPDNDVAMSDAEPLYSSHHMRASSNASSASSDTFDSPSTYSRM
ncbi:uncharacterized protein BT62DRAFT_931889 [Guyanagaster necrorhizus]|uniref:Uncharacterized protein n=1 Tax=Guyanagaster necrorhizus TaxID=856835 RepID=A0A9P7VV57_9AGAR|nr:uncharacterized protein BT62DRAFT_931889 [Guyanagaster necrorhizus MCA 3950]KAG7446456.1 hypothetical protein BT62DRAFT_931889 [Guyanagaster necrorhizus MCA 3950]